MEKKSLNTFIGTKEDAELWVIDNPYLLTGYRINYNSCKKVIKSLFECHNETFNIWSHLLGVLVIFILLFLVNNMIKKSD